MKNSNNGVNLDKVEVTHETVNRWVSQDLDACVSFLLMLKNDKELNEMLVDHLYARYVDDLAKRKELEKLEKQEALNEEKL